MTPLISEEELDMTSSDNKSANETMSTEMLEDVCEGSKSHPIINMREACYKTRDLIIQSQAEYKGSLLSMQNMGNILQKYFNVVGN